MSLSLWKQTVELPAFAPLPGDGSADVAVIGAGIAGLTAALLLQRAGKSVVVLEAQTLGGGETGRTTAHLTEVLDTRYSLLESRFGREGARAAAESARAAIDRIERTVGELGVECGYQRVPGYLYAETEDQRSELEQELECLRRAGAGAAWTDTLPLPFETRGAIRIEHQAQLHPLAYLRALAEAFVQGGGRLHEGTRAVEFEDGEPCRVVTERGTVTARQVLVLANVPVSSKLAIHTKIAAYRSYAIALPLEAERPGLRALFWDMGDPYHYIRTHAASGRAYLVVGGEDHKTGQVEDTGSRFAALETYAMARFGIAAPEYRWSGQIIEPADGLPFIGQSPGGRNLFLATGFSGTGMTFGTLSGMILADAVLGVRNPWAELYDATRVKPLAQARAYVSENVDFPVHLARDRVAAGEVERTEQIPPGEGRLIRAGAGMVAAYRDAGGTLHARSATCTHLGCNVRWNRCEASWDCPCHGSRFSPDGEVLNGPAVRALEEAPLADSPSADEHA